MSNSSKSTEAWLLADLAKQPGAVFTPTLYEQLPEKLLTFKAVAEALGIPYYKVQRAARARLFPVYRIYNGRPLLKLSEVMAVIDGSRVGGAP